MRGRANIPNSFIKEKPYKIRLLAISHDAYRAGSQIILLNFLRWIREREYAEVGILLRAGGALEREFEKVGRVWKLSPEAQRKSFRGWFSSGARQVAPLNKLADVLTSEYRPDVIYANTVMNGEALPYLRSLNAPIITHVHELDMWMRQSMSREQFAVVDRNTDLFVVVSDAATLEDGKRTFRFDTFGDETLWTDKLRMHEVIASAVDPTTALSVGLKVDAEALPATVVKGILDGTISLKSGYWSSRARAAAWAAGYSLQFEIGPLSEASIGNVGMRPETTGWVDHVITPIGAFGLIVVEDALDRYAVKWVEQRVGNRYLRMLIRMAANPGRTLSIRARGRLTNL